MILAFDILNMFKEALVGNSLWEGVYIPLLKALRVNSQRQQEQRLILVLMF
jgi:hypothetical protein